MFRPPSLNRPNLKPLAVGTIGVVLVVKAVAILMLGLAFPLGDIFLIRNKTVTTCCKETGAK